MERQRVLLIGGGGAAIGRATPRAFGQAGAAVAVADVDVHRAREAAEQLQQGGSGSWPLRGDVSVDQRRRRHGAERPIYELNLRYVARAVRAVLRVFLDQGTPGTIISIASVTGFMAAPHQAAYG